MSEPSDTRIRARAWRNWAGDQRCLPAAVEQPGSIEELVRRRSVAPAPATGVSGWRARGTRSATSRSPTACSCALDRLTRVLDVDRSSGLVRVQAGITIRELNARLAEHGLALENLGDVDVQTIAGAISTATHGTGARLRNISAQVAELTLVLADGSTLRVRARARPRDVPRRARRAGRARGRSPRSRCAACPRLRCAASTRPAPLEEVLDALRGAGARQRSLRVLRLSPRRHRAHAHEQPHR